MDLLCSAAFPGSGKSVVLSFNCFWFVKKTNGIAVEVTFNNDQGDLFNDREPVTSSKLLEQALAVRIIHRLLITLGCDQLKAEQACQLGGEVVQVVGQLEQPLTTAINTLRTKLSAPTDTKVLLCVDELSKATKSASYTAEKALHVLTRHLDRDETFFLAVSALGADDVINLSTGSNRHLMLQALGPLWFTNGLHPGSRRLLPDALRPFYDEKIRKKLPWDKDAKELYNALTKLLVTAAGHPRRLEVLLRELRRFVLSKNAAMVLANGSYQTAGRAFVEELAAWLQTPIDFVPDAWTQLEDITFKVGNVAILPTDYGMLVPGSDRPTTAAKAGAIEDLAVRSAAPFILPRDDDEKRQLKTVLQGVSKGFCQLVEVDRTGEGTTLFQAFIPLPVLMSDRPQPLQPCGEALFDLHDAVRKVYTARASGEEGKAFENAAVASILLLARGRDAFKLDDLCEKGGAGAELAGLKKLAGGPDVFTFKTSCWPADQRKGITTEDVQLAVDTLIASGAPGMLITVTDKFNIPADFYGLFKTAAGDKPFVLLRAQCKNWFRDAVYNKAQGREEDIVTKWRQHDKLAPSSVEVVVDGTTHTVPCVSLLFTANSLESPVKLQPLEGVITIASMRHWLPTAAHALQTLTHLREIFGWGYRESEEEDDVGGSKA